MKKIISILLLIMIIIGISGCIDQYLPYDATNHPEAQNVSVISSNGSFQDGKYNIAGILQNNNSFGVAFVTYNITGYDKNGKVVNNNWDYADTSYIPPGGKSNFDYYLNDPNHMIVKYKVIIVDADRKRYEEDISNSTHN